MLLFNHCVVKPAHLGFFASRKPLKPLSNIKNPNSGRVYIVRLPAGVGGPTSKVRFMEQLFIVTGKSHRTANDQSIIAIECRGEGSHTTSAMISADQRRSYANQAKWSILQFKEFGKRSKSNKRKVKICISYNNNNNNKFCSLVVCQFFFAFTVCNMRQKVTQENKHIAPLHGENSA